jgi:serine O-acetyltransferase
MDPGERMKASSLSDTETVRSGGGEDPSPSPWECFRADRARYPRSTWFAERSLWAIAVYRFGQGVLAAPRPVRLVLRPAHRVMLLICQILTNIEIATYADIGPGLRIHHAGPIVVGNCVIGADCTLRVGNILGNRNDSAWPTLGDRVTLGAGAQVLGGITLGNDVVVGAMSLVIHDVASGSTVAGIPAHTTT